MSLRDQIFEDMTAAMRAKEKMKLSVLRMVKSSITKNEIDKGEHLNDEEVLSMLNTLVKQRRDSASQFEKGGRPELAESELAEITLIEVYLPAAASSESIEAAVVEAISESGASSMKYMGQVMKLTLSKLEGMTADGKIVSGVVRSKLQ